MVYKIRKAGNNDLKIINFFLTEMNMLEFDEKSFHQSYRFTYVLEENNHICAFICFTIVLDEIELEAIYTELEMRKKGYGYLLMDKMENIAKKNNSKSIFLEVRESNKIAQHMYQKKGYNIVHKREKYYGKENGLVMKKELR